MNLAIQTRKRFSRRARGSLLNQSPRFKRAATNRLKRAADIIEARVEAVGTVNCHIEKLDLDTLRIKIDDKITKHHIQNIKVEISRTKPDIIANRIIRGLMIEPLGVQFVTHGAFYDSMIKDDD